MSENDSEITRLLKAWRHGDDGAIEHLVPLVYNDLRQIARRHMRRENPDQTLQTTAVVNEAYIRLVEGKSVDWQDRVHFFAVSAKIIRRVLVDAARSRGSAKRGANVDHLAINESIDGAASRGMDLLALDNALEELAKIDPRKVQVLELRFFGGLSVEETAGVLKVSPQTVMRDWKLTKAWILRFLQHS